MKEIAKQFLDRQIDRRTFVSRVAQVGVGASAASSLAGSLSASGQVGGAAPGRVLRGQTGGELMAEFLVDWKVPYVFGLGGSEEVGFLDALVDRLSLQYVQSLHEGSVMSMADGYARASGQTAIMNLHSVAGAGYALAPMVNAFKDRTPVVVTVGRQATGLRGTNAFLEAVNLHQLPRDYTRWTWDVMNAGTIPEVLRRAFLLARVPPGGPTFVTFSKDLWETPVEQAEIVPRSRSEVELSLEPDPDQVAEAARMLAEAEFPIIVVGREMVRYGGADEIMAIADLLGAPVFLDLQTSHAGVPFPTTHPHYSGMFMFDRDYRQDFDLYWSVGGTMFAFGGRPSASPVPPGAKVIHTGVDAEEIGRSYPVDLAMLADVRKAAAGVLAELRKRTLSPIAVDDRRRTVQAYAQARRQRLDDAAAARWNDSPISTARLTKELNAKMADDAIVVSELITSEEYLPAYMDVSTGTARRVNYTSSGGVLGWGVAAGVGAKIGRPDRQVVALVGDGSLQFGIQALWSATRYEVPLGVVVYNNGGYQANRKFLHLYGKRAAATGKYIGANLQGPDIDNVALCKGYGVEAERVDDPAELGGALDRCFEATSNGRPYLVDVRLARRLGGADSTWYDRFSIAKGEPRMT
ncbi:MAG: thiamine pyrophosphate-binding protein [Vicinamibacterales bacterium]|jgi:benzoylformate decarboxylase|nr:hypothetical protein [Acidobacteriota bacterium]MDP7472864.1 thiamine pyrophosphate-binding protein [Vicinamibacterales bacterium]MDP7670779.1 thiamine pyrophosphate-binding protein [Vicinamibacterales bacterium]HJO37786.1 thiamine pyrophosphate-binding protein [Vicinamibacterales bacterium]